MTVRVVGDKYVEVISDIDLNSGNLLFSLKELNGLISDVESLLDDLKHARDRLEWFDKRSTPKPDER